MLTSVLNDKESDLVNEVYRLDENPLYPIYIILPVDTESEEWKETEKQLVNWLDKSDQDIYLTTFQENIFTAIKRQIDYHMAQVRPKDILYEEVLENAIQCKMLNKRHFPCENILTKVKSFVLSNTSQPCIIYGNSGTGKSSMMAHLILKIPYWFLDPNSVSVIIRFLGTTPLSSDIRRPLISIIHQICALYHIDLSLSLNDSMIVQELKQLLEQIFTKIPTNERLVLLFDSIDQLQTENYDCSMWLPVNYPQNIKCILSTIPVIVETHTTHNKKEYKIVEGLMSHFNDATFIEITKFDEHLAQQVFDSWLQHDHRRLTPLQMNWLKPKLKSYIPPDRSDDPEPTPLFLSLLYDITLTWYSFDNEAEDNFLSIKRTYDAIKYLYNQMSKKHGEVLFKRAMTYFVLAGGLTDIELEDILSADNIVLQSVFVHYLPPLNIFRLPSILWIRIRNDMQKYLVEKDVDNTSVIYFYHRSFEHYNPFSREIPKLEFIRRAYFAENIGNFPNLNDQPFEIKSKKLIKKNNGISLFVVNRCLTKQLPFLHCYKMSDRLLADSVYPELRFLLIEYMACSSILDKYPDNFAFEISSRLSLLVDVLPEFTYNLLERCLNNCSVRMLKNETQLFDPSLIKYMVGTVHSLAQVYRYSIVLLTEKLVTIRSDSTDWYSKISEYVLPSNEYTSMKVFSKYLCLFSKRSLLVFRKYGEQIVMQLNIDHLLGIEFIGFDEQVLLICSKDNQSIDVWRCFDWTLYKQYWFDEPIEQCSFFSECQSAIIKVTFRTGIIQYLWVGFWRENLNVPITIKFEFLATLEEKLGDQSIFLNKETDIYYCEGQSYLRFYYFQRPKRIQLKRIQNLPPLNRIVYRYEDWGIIVNCALENGQLRKYNATIMTYLPVKFATLQENSSLREQIDYFEIQNNFIVTFDQAKCDVKLFTYSNRLSFVMHLRVSNAISQFVINSSYLLVFDCKNRLSIYSICSTPILLLETTEFYNESIKIHSLASSFLIVDGDKQQIFQINTDHPLVLRAITHLKIQCHSLLSTVVPKRAKLFILSDDNSTLTIWDLNTRIIKYLPTLINKSTQINKIYSLSTTIVFHDNRQRIYLWYIDNGNQIITFDHDRLEKEGNCLTLIDPNGNKLFVVHDINKSLYGDIRLEISLDTFCLTEDGKYLFGISQKESLLFMYRIDDWKCLEKIFIDNLSPLLKVSNDCLILLRNNELLLISIIDQDASTLKRAALTKTAVNLESSEINIKFDIVKASVAEHPEDTMFYEAYKQLKSDASQIFRRTEDEQVWKATYVGMFSIDQGGSYRDSITRICADLCST
ncbi:unnamed protein product [Rotaria sordida]|uniref:NACHT domain-containing protein n=1 Tax=Rotaria sordida TaxID=392033 RepID=A0A819E1M2_9BILA|nr:unnamed protein product [Rotaria sordida]